MLKALRLTNFKAWQELALPLGRITGVFGTNSSGKSSRASSSCSCSSKPRMRQIVALYWISAVPENWSTWEVIEMS